MWRWIERHPLLFVTGLLFSPLIVIGGLNLTGFCWKEMRYVPIEEKFIAAMRDVYKYYPPKSHKISIYYKKDINNPIKYKNFTDFVLRNPDCCRYTRWEIVRVSLLDRLMGYSPGTIRVEYEAYADEPEMRAKFFLEVITASLAAFGYDITNKAVPKEIANLKNKYIKLSEKANSVDDYNKLLMQFREEYRKLLQSLSKDDKERILANYVYDRNYGTYNEKNSTFIHFDNCGNVWYPFHSLRYRR